MQSGLSHAQPRFDFFARAFPTPKLLAPPDAGVDISDTSIKWLSLESEPFGYRVGTYGSIDLPAGIVVRGAIQDHERFVASLRELKPKLGAISFVHAALPEEVAYVFSMSVPPETPHEQVLRLIEFEFEGRVPIPVAESVYDYDTISGSEGEHGVEIAVTVFPRSLSDSYARAFEAAGLMLLSLELEARSIARAVSADDPGEPITLLADIGRARTGFSLLKQGVPIFTSTVEIGGDAITDAVVKHLDLSGDAVQTFKNEEGLLAQDKKSPAYEAIVGVTSALSDEVARHYHYWDTRRDERGERMSPVERVVLVGGSANLRGLSEYIAGRIQAPVEYANVWRRVCSFDDYIPPIIKRSSLQYATAIGLSLRSII